MNQVKTYIDKSNIEGIGLFAAEFIPQGKIIWKLSGLDQTFSKEEFEALKLNDIEKAYFHRYEFGINDTYFFCADDAKYCNHSKNANTIGNCFVQYAKTDINVGEEITCNYGEINGYFDESEFSNLTSYKPI